MLQAFDVLLQLPVNADIAAKNRIDEPFRYECLCCGEEVYVAAAESRKKSAHFRHRRGNSDRDCELYLGNVGIAGAVKAAKARQHSHSDIYFDYVQKVFFASFSFPAEKLKEYEEKSCALEFKTSFNSLPYDRVGINRNNFSSDSTVFFPLKLVSNDCYFSITNVGYNSHYQLLGENDFPTFFRVASTENQQTRAKRIVGNKIYTSVRYYALAKKQNDLKKLENYYPSITLSTIEEIDTLGITIYGAFVEISSITTELRGLFKYFNYEITASADVTLFWPPSWIEDGVICTNQKNIYISSSFDLTPRSNISCDDDSILSKKQGIYEIDVIEPVHIRFNNIDLSYAFRLPQIETRSETIEIVENTVVNVDDTEVCFMIGNDGYRELSKGKHRLTVGDRAVKYHGNYPVSVYTYPQKAPKCPIATLRDILTYYRVTIPFDEKLVQGYPLSSIAKKYIEDCRTSKQINIRALEYIKAGKI